MNPNGKKPMTDVTRMRVCSDISDLFTLDNREAVQSRYFRITESLYQIAKAGYDVGEFDGFMLEYAIPYIKGIMRGTNVGAYSLWFNMDKDTEAKEGGKDAKIEDV